MYALRFTSTGKPVGFRVDSNDDEDFCVSTQFILDASEDNVWVTTSRETADKAAVTNTSWFNAGFDTPTNPYVGQLEVVALWPGSTEA